jgi:hypothetical protein
VKTTPTKITTTKITPTKITPIKGKRKAIEREADVNPDYATETITLTAAELGIYYEEAYYTGRYTLIIANNLLVDLR